MMTPSPNNTVLLNKDQQMLVLQSSTKQQQQQQPHATNNTPASTNNTLKNLFATVQHLPRPRLIPFTPLTSHHSKQQHPTTPNTTTLQTTNHSINATTFARNAPRAGYLSKLGTSISEYKRRFFVLKPTTFLYYFLSPNDLEPRGCIDLEGLVVEEDIGGSGGGVEEGTVGLRIRELGCLADGRFRFELRLPIQQQQQQSHTTTTSTTNEESKDTTTTQQPQHRIISLEARNQTVGREWIRSLTTERLSYSKAQIQSLYQEKTEFQRQIEDYRHVEGDRDGAIQDAKEWRERYGKMDDALGVLMRWVRRESMMEEEGKDGGWLGEEGKDGEGCVGDDFDDGSPEEGTDDCGSSDQDDKSLRQTQTDPLIVDTNNQPTFLSISDEDKILDHIDLPGTNFASLSNACRGLREVLRHTSTEANTAVVDLRNANSCGKKLDKKLAKTEAIINKLWEENCELRDTMKQAKKEKKVLVREVRSLIANKKQTNEEMEGLRVEVQRLMKIVAADASNNRSREVIPLITNKKQTKEEMEGLRMEVQRLRKIVAADDTNSRSIEGIPKGHNTQVYQKDITAGGKENAPNVPTKKRVLATPEKKLLSELEEHVESSLRFHEQFLEDNAKHASTVESKKCCTVTTVIEKTVSLVDVQCKAQDSKLDPSEEEAQKNPVSSADDGQKMGNEPNLETGEQINQLPHQVFEAKEGHSSSSESDGGGIVDTAINRTFSPLRPKQLCLVVNKPAFDDVGCDADSVITSDSILPLQNQSSSLNVPQEIVRNSHISKKNNVTLPDTFKEKENRGGEYRGKHPLAKLNEEMVADAITGQCVSSSQSVASTQSLITDNGRATSQLVCPLADVMQLDYNQGEYSDVDTHKIGDLYHLTFYSSKIGLQFQKVPGNGSPVGMLTDAMTTDVTDSGAECATKASRMASELQKISLIRNQNHPKSTLANTDDSLCPMTVPADIVLVCGFCGFDDNTYTTKPSLGARLVAFDGISVERGPWTFDTVKKGIKARGRPLTLSFRDDFLTTKQRLILTKAAAEVEATIPPTRPTPAFQYSKRAWINDSISDQHCHRETTSAAPHEYPEQSQQPIPLTDSYNDHITDTSDIATSASESYSSRSENWQSFSDSGASSVFSTKFGPFMSGLMLGLSNNEERRRKRRSPKFTPEYFCRTTEPLDCISHHRDFKASLL